MEADIVGLKELSFCGYHGVTPEEKKIEQQFLVDVEIKTDLSKAAIHDDIVHAPDYSLVYKIVKQIVEGPSTNLLETLAENIASDILSSFSIDQVLVRVTKVKPPIPFLNQGSAYVEIVRQN